MIIGHISKTNGSVGNLAERISAKAGETVFSEILLNCGKNRSVVAGARSGGSERLAFYRTRVTEQRPTCIVCGFTISSEGTCMCEYPTVIDNRTGIRPNYNKSAQTKSDVPEITANQNIKISDGNTKTEKIKLRHRCPVCGTVSDDVCMCSALSSAYSRKAEIFPIFRN